MSPLLDPMQVTKNEGQDIFYMAHRAFHAVAVLMQVEGVALALISAGIRILLEQGLSHADIKGQLDFALLVFEEEFRRKPR